MGIGTVMQLLFLKLIKREKAEHYILKQDFETSEFSKHESLKFLISKLIENDILNEKSDRYGINGKVLNSIHFCSLDNN